MKLQLFIKEDYEHFLNPNRYYSYDYIHFFILMGGRGIGKTTSITIKALKLQHYKDEQFVIIRRYKSETQKAKNMFDKIAPSIKAIGIGEGGYKFVKTIKNEKGEEKKVVIGFLLTLSLQATFKSGINFDKVTTIIFDEAILQRGGNFRYMTDEVEQFLELISTIVRLRTNYKVFILGNNLDIFNPYYEYFNLPRFNRQYIDKERGLLVEEIPPKESFKELQSKTPLHNLIKGTAYGDYHDDNKVLIKSVGAIGNKSINAELLIRFVVNDRTINVYVQEGFNLFIELRDKIIKDNISFVIYENSKPNYGMVKTYRSLDISKYILDRYSRNKIINENETARELFNVIMEEIK